MEQQALGWRDQHLARQVIRLHRFSGTAAWQADCGDLSGLLDTLGRQLAERGVTIRHLHTLGQTFWTLLDRLVPRRGRKVIYRPGLPPIDAELLATLLAICHWMTRLERPAWHVERAKCVICGRGRALPRIMKMDWLSKHVHEHQDRVAGVLIGLAAGDENGGPTQMALRLAQSLLAAGRYDPDDVFGRYLEWHRQGSYDTGPVAGRVFDLGLRGVTPDAAARQVDAEFEGMTAGCNAAHRTCVLAMAPWLSTRELVVAARREAGLTHHHPIAADAAVAMAVECRDRIMNRGWGLGHSRHIAPTLHKEVARAVCSLHPSTHRDPPTAAEAAQLFARDGYSPHTLRAGLYFALGARDPAEAMAEAKKFAGPANYCPVLAGALLGATFGASALSDSLLAHHPASHIEEIKAVAWQIADRWRPGNTGALSQDIRSEEVSRADPRKATR
jgi:ADP-ribosyl-[dinitrogen reductase] hydrolase